VTTTATTIRRGTLAILWIMAAAAVFRGNSINYVIGPAATTFGLDGSGTQQFKLIPNIGQLLVVFLAGILAERIGARRTLAWGALGLTLGGLACTIAPMPVVMDLGLLIAASGTSMMMVSIFAVVGRNIHGTENRARAFGILATAMPIISLVSPFICSWLVDSVSWRAATLAWALFGAIALFAALLGLEKDEPSSDRNEYLTPMLAGMLLVAAVELLNGINGSGSSTANLIYALIGLASLIGIVVARRRMARTSLSLTPVRNRIPLLMLLAVAVGTLTYQWYVGFLAFQNIFGMDDIQIAVAMIPTQVVCIIAARVAPKVIVARGLRATAVYGTVISGLSCALFIFVDAGQSAVILSLIMAVYGFLATLAAVAVNNAAMNSLPSEHSGAMSAFRSASSAFGSAVTAVLMGALLIGAYDASLSSQSAAAGLDSATSVSIGESLNSGMSYTDASTQAAVPQTEVTEVSDLSVNAMADALHVKSLASTVIGLLAAALLAAAMRRRKGAYDEEPALA